ncbi:SDR family oxidoreductase [bacterium]|nr:SDR family oxidoreductase [bacterium]MBU1752638.1 SDR family oxidoreductase [bacterium]
MAVYLITGGAGFIGSNIVARLVKNKERVRIIDNFSTGKRENIAEFLNNIEVVDADISNIDSVREAVSGVDFVLHQAALPSVARSVADPIRANEVNIVGTLNILVAARDAKVKRVVYASSSSAYGDTPTLPKREDMKTAPLSPYAITKLTGEEYCKVFYSLYGLETIALRYFNVFGPNQDPTSHYSAVIPKFITLMLTGNQPTIYGDGGQSRDFSYIDNVVNANLNATVASKGIGEAFNIACGERITLNELCKKINKILSTDFSPVYADTRPGDVRHSLADISKAQSCLNYSPEINVDQGLEMTVEWYRQRVSAV